MAELHNPLIPKSRRRLIVFTLFLLLFAGVAGALYLLPDGGPLNFASRQSMDWLESKDPATFASASRTERELWMRVLMHRAAAGKNGRSEVVAMLAKHEPAFRDFLLEMLRRGSEDEQAMVREALTLRQKAPKAGVVDTAYLSTLSEVVAFPPPVGLAKPERLVLWFREMMPFVPATAEANVALLDAIVMLLRAEAFWAHVDDPAYHAILQLNDRPGVAARLKEKLDDARYDRLQRIGVSRLGIGILKDAGSHDRFREGCVSLWEKPDATIPDLILNQAKRFCFREIFAMYPQSVAYAFATWLFVEKMENPEEIRDELTTSPLEPLRIPPLAASLRQLWLNDLKSPDKTRVRLALTGLARLGPSSEALTAVLEVAKDPALVEDAVPAIAVLGAQSPAAVAFLSQAATSGGWPLVARVTKSMLTPSGDVAYPEHETVLAGIAKRTEEYFRQPDDKISGGDFHQASATAARLGVRARSIGPRLVALYLAKKPEGKDGAALLQAIAAVPAPWRALTEEARTELAARYLDVLSAAAEKKPGPAEPVCHLANFGSSYRSMDLNPLFLGRLGDLALPDSLRKQLASKCAEPLGEVGLMTLAISLADKERKGAMAVNTATKQGHEWLAAELQLMSDLALRGELAEGLSGGRWAEPAIVKAGAVDVTRAKGKALLHGRKFLVLYDTDRVDESAVPAPLKAWAKAERKKAEKRKEKCRSVFGRKGDVFLADVECASRVASLLSGKKGALRKIDPTLLHGNGGFTSFAPILVFSEPTVEKTLPAAPFVERKPDPASPLQKWFADTIAKTDGKEPGSVTMRQWSTAAGTPVLGGVDVASGGVKRSRLAVVFGGQILETGDLADGARVTAAFDLDGDGLVEVETEVAGSLRWYEFDGKRFGRVWFSSAVRGISSRDAKR